jgi:hypothetical protein
MTEISYVICGVIAMVALDVSEENSAYIFRVQEIKNSDFLNAEDGGSNLL